MSIKIKTNKLVYEIDRDAFAMRFDVFTIETDDKYIKSGAYILDAPSLNESIKSIRFESGQKDFVLMLHNEENRNTLGKFIKSLDGGDKLSLASSNVRDIPDYVILQLLLNALSTYDTDALKFNNLTGHFYCFHSDWIKHKKEKSEDITWKVPCLEISITKDYYVNMNVRTFTSERLKKSITFHKRKFEDYPKYIFGKNHTLRRKLSGETEPGFIMRQVDGTKTELPFLDIQNEEKFEKCKVGTLARVINEFNSKYDPCAHIDCGYVEAVKCIDYNRNTAKENSGRIHEILSECEIHIVDQIGDQYSAQFCEEVKELITRKYDIIASIGKRVSKDALNICLIHNAEYYADMADPHDKEYPGTAIQHITLEDFKNNAEFALSAVIHDVLIKKDLVDYKITLFDWPSLGLENDVAFGIETEIDETNRYYFMQVHPDGTFYIKEQELNLFEMNEYNDCVDIFENARTSGETVKGVIRSHEGKINVIKDTGIITLPEINEIKTLLSTGDNKLRGKERRGELLSSCLDIKLFEESGKQFYFVGTIGEGMRWNIPRAANVRSIEGYNGAACMFDKLLPTMNVTFVHNGQLTVLPFPFKYLREHLRLTTK